MIDAEIKRYINHEIERRINLITSGVAGTNTETTQDIEKIYPGHPTIEKRPIMHPYGVVSRAPNGTPAVTAQQGSHPGNKMTLGHKNPNPPSVGVGEVAIYSLGKYTVKVFNNQVQVGKNGDYETLVVGETLKSLLIGLIDAIVAHTHLGNLGYPTGTPINASSFNDLKANNLSNDKILAKDGGRF